MSTVHLHCIVSHTRARDTRVLRVSCVRVYFVSSFAEIRDYAQSFVRFVVKTLCSARHIRLTKTLTDQVAHFPY